MSQNIFAKMQQHRSHVSLILLLVLFAACPPSVQAATPPDPVLEWNAIMNDTVLAGGTNPLVTSRVVALVSASVFDAVNGVRPRYQSLHIKPAAPRHASQRAAAIQAAYAMLVNIYPAQIALLTAKRDASIGRSPREEIPNPFRPGSPGGSRSPTASGPGDKAMGSHPIPRRFSAFSVLSERPQPWAPGDRHRC